MFQLIFNKWNSYKYRFVPWLLFSFKSRSVQRKSCGSHGKVQHDAIVHSILDVLSVLAGRIPPLDTPRQRHKKANQLLLSRLRFELQCLPSLMPGAGRGVFVRRGTVPAHAVVCWYPGTVYLPGDPLLLPSVGNSYIFRCADGQYVDGRGDGLSGVLFGSCAGRDQMGPHPAADRSWRTDQPSNPLAIGQIVNNHGPGYTSNVCYQEVDLPPVPYPLRRYLPYARFHARTEPPLRAVVLISQRDIQAGEELLAEYFTVVHQR